MMKFCARSFSFAKIKQVNYKAGEYGEQPDLENGKYELYHQWFRRLSVMHAGVEQPNFNAEIHDLDCLERSEIQTRILRVIRDLELIEIKKFNFEADMRKDLRLDSLNLNEFTTVFEDNLFESVRTMDQIVTYLMRDNKIY